MRRTSFRIKDDHQSTVLEALDTRSTYSSCRIEGMGVFSGHNPSAHWTYRHWSRSRPSISQKNTECYRAAPLLATTHLCYEFSVCWFPLQESRMEMIKYKTTKGKFTKKKGFSFFFPISNSLSLHLLKNLQLSITITFELHVIYLLSVLYKYLIWKCFDFQCVNYP